MILLDTALRGGAAALLLLFGVLLVRDAKRAVAGIYGALLALGGACFAVASSPVLAGESAAWIVPLRLVAFGEPALLWLFAAACFDDDYRPGWRDAAVWGGLVALGALCQSQAIAFACLVHMAVALGLLLLAIREALVSHATDLWEERRRFRVGVIIATALYAAFIMVGELSTDGRAAERSVGWISAAVLLAIGFAVCVSRLAFRSLFIQVEAAPAPVATVTPIPAEEPQRAPDPHEAALLQRLRHVMEEEKAYREEGLSVASLATQLGIPEYRLRRLINQALGHRNFSSYVNGYRLAEAKAALADPAQAEVPILTIALDAGFQSIGPFNRAFKAETGLTPSEFRRNPLPIPESASPAAEIG